MSGAAARTESAGRVVSVACGIGLLRAGMPGVMARRSSSISETFLQRQDQILHSKQQNKLSIAESVTSQDHRVMKKIQCRHRRIT
jgi:hypothetical protein